MVFSVVDLPTPLRPSRPTTSPRPTVERDAVQDVALAVIGVHVLDQDERLGVAGRRRRSCLEIDLQHLGVLLDFRPACPSARMAP